MSDYASKFKVFGPYTRKEDGRKIVITIDNKSGKRRTVSFPKWKMECYLGKQLGEDDTIDHWDSNFLNDSISNLRIMPRKEHSTEDTRRVKLIEFKCPMCENTFSRSPRIIREKAKKKSPGPFCGKACAARYTRQVANKKIKKLKPQRHIDSEYYKKKYVLAFAEALLQKYASEDISDDVEELNLISTASYISMKYKL